MLRHKVAAVLLSLGSLVVLLAVVVVIGEATSTTTTPHAGTASVLTAPVRIVHTPAGTIGYREVGTGTPLLLIVGADASMDYWPPGFVDALAAHHKVVVFDNAEVGRTTAVPGTAHLTIPAMASQGKRPDLRNFRSIARLHPDGQWGAAPPVPPSATRPRSAG